jgi:N-acetylneuraminate synthase
MSGNHNQSLERSLSIVDAAAAAGAHALKIQTFTADTMTLDLAEGDFLVSDKGSLWRGTTLHALYESAYTPWEWHRQIFERATQRGLIAFSTPFDATAVDFLESLDAPFYKIASFENTDLELIRKVAATGKPMLVSTGMASAAELERAVNAAREAGCRDLVLLKCTSSYPATPEHSNVVTLPHMRELFACEVGLSDHTMGVGVAVAAVAFGATVVEKHFTLSRAEGGVDSAFSLEPAELASLVAETERAWQSIGRVSYGPTAAERSSLIFRRGLRIVVDLNPGDVITRQNVRAIRPGGELSSGEWPLVLGRVLKKAARRGEPLTWDLLS